MIIYRYWDFKDIFQFVQIKFLHEQIKLFCRILCLCYESVGNTWEQTSNMQFHKIYTFILFVLFPTKLLVSAASVSVGEFCYVHFMLCALYVRCILCAFHSYSHSLLHAEMGRKWGLKIYRYVQYIYWNRLKLQGKSSNYTSNIFHLSHITKWQ